MDAVWRAGPEGRSVGEIWQELSARRPIARTTVLTTVGRLEKKGWLVRKGSGRSHRYYAAEGPDKARNEMARRFLDQFFGGSASALVKSLLGSRRIKPAEVRRLRRLLDERDAAAAKKTRRGKTK